MACEQPPQDPRLLADPSQEVLVAHRSTFSQLAPVPLSRLGADPVVAGEPYLSKGRIQRD